MPEPALVSGLGVPQIRHKHCGWHTLFAPMLNQFNGRIDLVLAGYNAGEGAVMKLATASPHIEKRGLRKTISYRYRRNKAVAIAPIAMATSAGTAGN